MRMRILNLVLILYIISFVSAIDCVEDNCTKEVLSECEENGGICSIFTFNKKFIGKYNIEGLESEDYGLNDSNFDCPGKLNCYNKIFVTYNGSGNYTLFPGDEVLMGKGLIIKYGNYQENISSWTPEGTKWGNLASIQIYNGSINYSNFGQNLIPLANIFDWDNKEYGTFSNGYYFKIKPLKEGSREIEIEFYEGNLSVCMDTDAPFVGANTLLELPTGKWGRNYYEKGIATETMEDSEGRRVTEEEDSCSEGVLTEFYCDNNIRVSEEIKCTCISDGACKKTFIGTFKEWIMRLFD